MTKDKIAIVKIGGNIIEDKIALKQFLQSFSKLEGKKILIHGGGKRATQFASKLGIASKMVDGRRITDKETLEVITMVYAGLVNKKIVAQLQAFETNAMGLTGADINSIQSEKRPVKEIDFGFVGDVKKINHHGIDTLMASGFTPVFCALTHDGNGQLLNTNADTIASQIAIGMSKIYTTTLYYCFELKGVLNDFKDKESVIQKINSKTYKELLAAGTISAGMLPKLENCFDALQKGVQEVLIGNTTLFSKEENNLHTKITL